MNKKFFKAQALAIVMVVLVVVSIIGMALFSRMAKDKRLAVEEQNSAAAAQVAEGILDVMVGADIDKLESVDQDLMPINTFDEIKNFINSQLNLPDSADALPDDDAWCEGGDSSANENTYVKLNIRPTTEDEYPEVQPGSVRSYNLQDATVTSPCNLQLKFRAKDDQVVFAIKFVYDPDSGTPDKFLGYCAFSSGVSTDCSPVNDVSPTTSLNSDVTYHLSWDSNAYKIPPINLYDEYNNGLIEIRVLPIKGVIGVSGFLTADSVDACIDKQFTPIKVIADAMCNGASMVYEMTLPGSGNLGYSTLFDYGIYDTGEFRLKH